VREQLVRATVDDLHSVVTPDDLRWVQGEVRRTHVADGVLDFALNVVRATRRHPQVRIGASSRAALALVRCAQARSLIHNRDYVAPDDIKALAANVLGHRLVLRRGAVGGSGAGAITDVLGAGGAVVAEVLASAPVPVRG
jgi:MoxR-like ATPase